MYIPPGPKFVFSKKLGHTDLLSPKYRSRKLGFWTEIYVWVNLIPIYLPIPLQTKLVCTFIIFLIFLFILMYFFIFLLGILPVDFNLISLIYIFYFLFPNYLYFFHSFDLFSLVSLSLVVYSLSNSVIFLTIATIRIKKMDMI